MLKKPASHFLNALGNIHNEQMALRSICIFEGDNTSTEGYPSLQWCLLCWNQVPTSPTHEIQQPHSAQGTGSMNAPCRWPNKEKRNFSYFQAADNLQTQDTHTSHFF